MSRLQTDPQSCVAYRRYLAGDVRYADLNPSEAQLHLTSCRNGCPDYWTTISFQGCLPPLPDIRPILQAGAAVCRLNQNLADYVPEPGQLALHVLLCCRCRTEHVALVGSHLRELYQTGKALPVSLEDDVCLPIRRYLAGDLAFAHVNAGVAENHLAECQRGCHDFWRILNLSPEPASEKDATYQVSVCPDVEDLSVFHARPGSVAMHLLICDACRMLHRQMLVEIYRKRYVEASAMKPN